MNLYTYTLIVKTDLPSWEIERMVKEKLKGLPVNPVVARISDNSEVLVLLHTENDSSKIGCALADWLREMPHDPPFPAGTLLWYR